MIERIFFCGRFYQSYGPLLLQMLLQQWGHQCWRTHSRFTQLYLTLYSMETAFITWANNVDPDQPEYLTRIYMIHFKVELNLRLRQIH
jgi:hypothetical protein